MAFASFDVYSYTRGGRDFSKKQYCWRQQVPAPSHPFSFLFRAPGIANWHILDNPRSSAKNMGACAISGEASSPGVSQTLSHLSLETPCEVGCAPRTEAQKGKETWRWKVIGGASLLKPSRSAQVCDFPTVKSIHQASMTWLQKPRESLQSKHETRFLECRKRPSLKATGPPKLLLWGLWWLIISFTNWRSLTPWSSLQIASSCSSPNLICYHDFTAHPYKLIGTPSFPSDI